jgi:uncharacterized protein with FMN-binding domain
MKLRIALIALVIALLIPALAVAQETLRGTGDGYAGDIVVDVVMQGDNITEVKLVEFNETPGLSNRSRDMTIQRIVESDSADVDLVTGATATSQGIVDAVEDALSKR